MPFPVTIYIVEAAADGPLPNNHAWWFAGASGSWFLLTPAKAGSIERVGFTRCRPPPRLIRCVLHDDGNLAFISVEGIPYVELVRNSGVFGSGLLAAEEATTGSATPPWAPVSCRVGMCRRRSA